MPKGLPSVNDSHRWLAMTAAALVEASTYDGRADVAWFSKVNDPVVTFGSFADSGKDRFTSLDLMLSSVLQSKVGRSGDLGRLVGAKAQGMHRTEALNFRPPDSALVAHVLEDQR